MIRATALLIFLLLGACTARTELAATPGARFANLDAAITPNATARIATPVAILPAWVGRTIRLRERDTGDGIEQEMDLDAGARGDTRGNRVRVTMQRNGGSGPSHATARAMKPTALGIQAELDSAFPGVAMQVVTRPASNAHGPYGLAIGRLASGARCLYAWQWIEDAEALVGQPGLEAVSVRIRLCRDDVTLEALAAAVNQLRLVPRGEGTAVAPLALAVAPAKTAGKRAHRGAAGSPEPSRRRGEAFADGASAQGNAMRRHSDAEPPLRPVAMSGRSFVAPETSVIRSLAGPAKPETRASINPDLPAEAYRGPVRPAIRP